MKNFNYLFETPIANQSQTIICLYKDICIFVFVCTCVQKMWQNCADEISFVDNEPLLTFVVNVLSVPVLP